MPSYDKTSNKTRNKLSNKGIRCNSTPPSGNNWLLWQGDPGAGRLGGRPNGQLTGVPIKSGAQAENAKSISAMLAHGSSSRCSLKMATL